MDPFRSFFLTSEIQKEDPFIYWSSRNKIHPPLGATFHALSFASGFKTSFRAKQRELSRPASYKIKTKKWLPDLDGWKKGVQNALKLIEEKKLEKIVLGRLCILDFKETVDPFAVAASLEKRSEGAFLFCLGTDSEGFLGATPERLFQRKKTSIETEAVAGTRPRGSSQEEDLFLQKELLNSIKDFKEITPVQNHLKTCLDPFLKTPSSFDPISLHQTQTVQHLFSGYRGSLKEQVEDPLLASLLQPTPALAGFPKDEALKSIGQLEPFSRGLFGGSLGWSTEEESEWIVAIRSCLIQEKKVFLFSGAGIVEGSHAEKEWDELNQKIKIYDRIFID